MYLHSHEVCHLVNQFEAMLTSPKLPKNDLDHPAASIIVGADTKNPWSVLKTFYVTKFLCEREKVQ
jgi:hypothetical protein